MKVDQPSQTLLRHWVESVQCCLDNTARLSFAFKNLFYRLYIDYKYKDSLFVLFTSDLSQLTDQHMFKNIVCANSESPRNIWLRLCCSLNFDLVTCRGVAYDSGQYDELYPEERIL